MKKELSPAIGWVAIVVVVLLVVFMGYKFIAGPPADMDKKGADTTMQRVKAGGKMYEPPPGAIPGGGSGSPSGSAPGGYNMNPPSH